MSSFTARVREERSPAILLWHILLDSFKFIHRVTLTLLYFWALKWFNSSIYFNCPCHVFLRHYRFLLLFLSNTPFSIIFSIKRPLFIIVSIMITFLMFTSAMSDFTTYGPQGSHLSSIQSTYILSLLHKYTIEKIVSLNEKSLYLFCFPPPMKY